MDTMIGYLVDGTKVYCDACVLKHAGESAPAPLYRENIGSYKQSCHGCGMVIVLGMPCGDGACGSGVWDLGHTHWPELYNKKTDNS